jgi:hypothetical protein
LEQPRGPARAPTSAGCYPSEAMKGPEVTPMEQTWVRVPAGARQSTGEGSIAAVIREVHVLLSGALGQSGRRGPTDGEASVQRDIP